MHCEFNKIAIISKSFEGDRLHIMNMDGTHHQQFDIYTGNTYALTKTLTWITQHKLRLFMDTHPWSKDKLAIANFHLRGPGTYELTFDDYNFLIAAKRFN